MFKRQIKDLFLTNSNLKRNLINLEENLKRL